MPYMMPSREPTVAPVQSVSSPQSMAMIIDFLKSHSPQSRPRMVKATLPGAWNQPSPVSSFILSSISRQSCQLMPSS